MSGAANQGDERKSASRPSGGDDPAALRARIAQLEAELQRLHDAEHGARQREQHLAMHNLVLVNLSRSAAIEDGDLNAAFEQITVAAAHTLNVERASIWLFNEERSAIRCLDLYERSKDLHSEGLELKAADFPAYFRAVEDNRTLAADAARTDPRTSEFDVTYLEPLGITSMLDAPVRRGGKLIGVICHEHVGPPREWSLEDQAFAGSMADFVALTIQAHERAAALQAIGASERQLRQIIDLVPHMIMAKDGRGRILLANMAVADAYGLGFDQLIGHRQWDIHPVRDEVAAMLSDDLRVIETGEKHVLAEEHFTDVRGRQHILQTTKIPFMFSAAREPAVLGVSIDITQRTRDEHVRRMLVQELDHRVRNNLAIVTSIAEQTVRETDSIEEFADAFIGRLRALALTHEMLASTGWEGADLRGMIQRLVEPFRQDRGRPRVVLDGEVLCLPASIAPCMCMLLHELATNAAKHGALSSDAGNVLLSWQREMRREGERRSPWLLVEWKESGGPKVAPPTHTGFGTMFIQQAAASQLRGQSTLHFEPAGVRCVIEVPLEHPCVAAET